MRWSSQARIEKSFMAHGKAVRKSLLPLVAGAPLVAPSALECLRCALLGRRALLCSRADVCKGIPRAGLLGVVLLAGCLAMVVAFIMAIR